MLFFVITRQRLHLDLESLWTTNRKSYRASRLKLSVRCSDDRKCPKQNNLKHNSAKRRTRRFPRSIHQITTLATRRGGKGTKPKNQSSRIVMHTHVGSTIHNPVTLTFDLLIWGSMHADILPYSRPMWTKFGVDSSSRFPTRARTHIGLHTHTESQMTLYTHTSAYRIYAWVINISLWLRRLLLREASIELPTQRDIGWVRTA